MTGTADFAVPPFRVLDIISNIKYLYIRPLI
jgi:hypothetical protein